MLPDELEEKVGEGEVCVKVEILFLNIWSYNLWILLSVSATSPASYITKNLYSVLKESLFSH